MSAAAAKPRAGDWVVAVMAGADTVGPRAHAHCTRCGERFVFSLPMSVDAFVATTRAFVKVHKKCQPRPVT